MYAPVASHLLGPDCGDPQNQRLAGEYFNRGGNFMILAIAAVPVCSQFNDPRVSRGTDGEAKITQGTSTQANNAILQPLRISVSCSKEHISYRHP